MAGVVGIEVEDGVDRRPPATISPSSSPIVGMTQNGQSWAPVGLPRPGCRPSGAASRGDRRRTRARRRRWGAHPATGAPSTGVAVGIDVVASGDPGGDLLDGVVHRDAVALRAVAVAEGDRAGLGVGGTGEQHERDLLLAGGADLLLHAVVGVVDLDPDARGAQLLRDVHQVGHLLVGDRDADHLHRCEPGRERAGVVLGEDAEEPLDRAELRRVDHHRLLARPPSAALVLQAEPGRLVEVVLDGRHLPGAADGVAGLHGDLRAVERRAARVGDELQAGSTRGLLEDGGGVGPLLVRPDELVPPGRRRGWTAPGSSRRGRSRAAGRARSPAGAGSRRAPARGDVAVRVVLGQATHPGQAVDDAGLLVPVHRAELEEPQRQLAVGPPARPEDQVVHRAVHGLEVVLAFSSSIGGNMVSA